jgi:hypothetical protein
VSDNFALSQLENDSSLNIPDSTIHVRAQIIIIIELLDPLWVALEAFVKAVKVS